MMSPNVTYDRTKSKQDMHVSDKKILTSAHKLAKKETQIRAGGEFSDLRALFGALLAFESACSTKKSYAIAAAIFSVQPCSLALGGNWFCPVCSVT